MALKNQLSFASGEIDPVLHDRVTLDRFQNGLETARNVMVGKTGSVISRFSTAHFKEVSHTNPVICYHIPGTKFLLEFGIRADGRYYVDTHEWFIFQLKWFVITNTLFAESNPGDEGITADNLKYLSFSYDGEYVYINLGENTVGHINLHLIRVINNAPSGYDTSPTSIFETFPKPIFVSASVTSSTGYDTEYAITYVRNGQESLPLYSNYPIYKRPIATGERVDLTITVKLNNVGINEITSVRVYRRPKEGGAYGLVGVTSEIYVNGSNDIESKFTDFGGDADFTNGIPILSSKDGAGEADNVAEFEVKATTIHQGRLLLGNLGSPAATSKTDAILASRPGFRRNFYRDFPLDSDSSLFFGVNASENGKILRMISSDGLIVFTNDGVYSHSGLLSPTNLAFVKRGKWIIKGELPPLSIPGALLFVDKTTNSVRQLIYSNELNGYDSIEQSIFSNHLFREKDIKSWGFQEGSSPLLIVTFDDGTFATFTYNFEHKMRAWTRHDGKYPVEQIIPTTEKDLSFMVVNKNGTRQIVRTIPRFITPEERIANPEADISENGALMDSLITSFDKLNNSVAPADDLTFSPVTPGDWSGDLNVNSGASPLFNTYGNPGEVYRIFNSEDGTYVDLNFVSKTDNFNIVVTPSEEFPSSQAVNPNTYLTQTTITGLDHLEGEEVSVMVDGDVVSSPYNDNVNDSFTTLTVMGGEITIPDHYKGAVTVVGRPIVADTETLNLSTVEQSPVMIESLTVDKLYIRTFESRGLFVDWIFPENKTGDKDGTSVKDMQNFDNYVQKSGVPITANRHKRVSSERVELTLPGSWETQGKIAIRQVDPLHFQILSIIPDVEIKRRSNR